MVTFIFFQIVFYIFVLGYVNADGNILKYARYLRFVSLRGHGALINGKTKKVKWRENGAY